MAHPAKNVSPEAEVKSWGFKQVFTWTDPPPGFDDAPHPKGSLTITYPEDDSPAKETHAVGRACRRASGRQHEVWVGTQGFDHGHRE
ncbi:hypothetical protein EV126DRAFT_464831 [Verticillium dahliae]|nr:hypothetical protein EV126DRAFT_464831 [Verticillium dahliae]